MLRIQYIRHIVAVHKEYKLTTVHWVTGVLSAYLIVIPKSYESSRTVGNSIRKIEKKCCLEADKKV